MKKPAWGRLAGQRAKSEHSPLRITSKTGLPDLALARYVREAEVRTAAGQPREVGLPCQARGDGLSCEGEFVMVEVLLFGFSIGCVPMAFLVLITLLVAKRLRE